MELLLLLFWAAIFGGIGSQIGKARGRESAGFLWGVLLGPLGWLVILVGPDRRPKCPECRGVVVAGARRCKNCGSEIVEVAELAVPVPPKKEHVCLGCGDVLPTPHYLSGGLCVKCEAREAMRRATER